MTDERTPYRFEVALRKWRAQLGILEKGRARDGVLSVGIFACHRVRFRLYSAPFVRFSSAIGNIL